MTLSAANLDSNTPLQVIGREYGCDWIRMIDPIHRLAQSHGVPDVTDNYTVMVGTIFCCREETRTKDFWCHEVEWSIDGRRFVAAVPMKLKSEWSGGGFFAYRLPVEDGQRMFDWLIRAIECSRRFPEGAEWIDLGDDLL